MYKLLNIFNSIILLNSFFINIRIINWLSNVAIADPTPPYFGINKILIKTFNIVAIRDIFIIELCLLKINIMLLKISAGNTNKILSNEI